MEKKKSRSSSLAGKLGRDVFFGTSIDLPKIIEVDLDQVSPNPDQPRKTFKEESIQELAASIDKHGLIQPITIKQKKEGDYILVAGERRFRAHQILQRKTIAAILTTGNVDEIALIENIQREDINSLDTAEALSQMIDRYQYTQEELGRVLGKAQSTISEFLKLNDLPEQIKFDYRTSDKNFSKSVLIELSRVTNEDEQLKLWDAIKHGELSVRATRSRKVATTPSIQKSSTDQLFVAGHKFIKTLAKVDIQEIINDPDRYLLLMEICNQVKTFAEAMQQQDSLNNKNP